MASYNGHRSWNAWNVSLWINNDEGLYRLLMRFYREGGTKLNAVRMFMEDWAGEKTPDGAPYSFTNVLRAMVGWEK